MYMTMYSKRHYVDSCEYYVPLTHSNGVIPDSDKPLAHRPPQALGQGCEEEALEPINMGTKSSARGVSH